MICRDSFVVCSPHCENVIDSRITCAVHIMLCIPYIDDVLPGDPGYLHIFDQRIRAGLGLSTSSEQMIVSK